MQRVRPAQLRNNSAFLAMLAACSVVFLTALDQTVVVTALPKIIVDLSITVQQLDRAAWIVSGYLLGFIIAMPLMGRISDIYGRRAVFLICLGIFALGSLFCGLAPILGNALDISFLQHIGINVSAPGDFSDPNALAPGLVWLVAARFVQAIGGGAMIPVAMAVAGDFYGEKQRGLALGLIGMVTETGGVLGPLWGAVITQTLGWQAIFYINVPIVALLALLIWCFIPSPKAQPTSPNAGTRFIASATRIDFIGTLLLGASLLCLSLGLSQEAITAAPGATTSQSPVENNPWLIGASLLLLAGFVALELFLERGRASVPAHRADGAESRPMRRVLPVIELSVFRRFAFSATSLVSLLVGSALIIAMVDIPFFIDTVMNGSALDSGLALLRLTAMIPVGAIVGGLLCPRITCRVTAVIGLLLTALGFLLMHLWPLDVNWLQITASTIIGGLGFGLVIAPIGTTAINAVSNQQLGMASSVITVLRMVGMIVGLAALTSWGLGRFHTIITAFKPPVGVTPFSAPYQAALSKYATFAGHEVYTSIFLAAGIICLVAIVPALLLEGKKASPYAIPGTV
ncbi:MAG TPA: MFS transporter [Ktedonobacteraceae bacterium]|nr:MFS transporter [Ktedonobacteraceae bacterium]